MEPEPRETHPGAVTPVRLVSHADSCCASVRSLEARAYGLRPGVMGVEFTLMGELDGVRIPPVGRGERADALWRRTCFEAFVRCDDVPGYLELNFSPSGAWQAYHFGAHRQHRTSAAVPVPPHITVGHRRRGAEPVGCAVSADDALLLEALVHLPAPYAAARRTLRLGLSAVVEEQTGGLSYWAVHHAPGRPDFHHPDAFVLVLHWS